MVGGAEGTDRCSGWMTTQVEKATLLPTEVTCRVQRASGLQSWGFYLCLMACVHCCGERTWASSPTTRVSFEAIRVGRLQLSRCLLIRLRGNPHTSASAPSFSNISSKRVSHLSETHPYLHRRGRRRRTRLDRQTDTGQNEGRLLGPCRSHSGLVSPNRKGSLHGTGLETHIFSHLKLIRATPSKSLNYQSIYLERFQGTKPRTFLLWGASCNVSDSLHSMALKCC